MIRISIANGGRVERLRAEAEATMASALYDVRHQLFTLKFKLTERTKGVGMPFSTSGE